jgi:integrase
MPRIRKGPRLWFRPERFDKAGKRISNGAWIIIDGNKHVATGCLRGEEEAANAALAEYTASQYRPPRRERDIEQIKVAEVLAIYDADCRDSQANKRTFDGRMVRLNNWWGDMFLSDINGQTCRDYAKGRKIGGARRDLEDLRAAINHHAKEGLHRGVVRVALPPKGLPRDRWLTRSEVAKMVWACWRHREVQTRHRGSAKGMALPTKKRPLQHIARFILIAAYTGSRAGAIAAASPYRKEGRSWVDLEAGLFYRLPEGARATNKRQPPVPIPEHLLAHMRRWKRLKISTSHFIEHRGVPVKEINKGYARAVALAGLEGKITPHTLRHTAATWLMQNGVEIWEAAGYLGMSEKTLRDVYGHHHPSYMRGAAEGIRRRKITSNASPMESTKINATKAEQTQSEIDKNEGVTDT